MERQSLTFRILIHLAALLLAIVILAPVLWLFVMSISPGADLSARPLTWWPSTVDWSRYATLLSRVDNTVGAVVTTSLTNSLLVAGMATLAAIAVAVPAGWAVSRTVLHNDPSYQTATDKPAPRPRGRRPKATEGI